MGANGRRRPASGRPRGARSLPDPSHARRARGTEPGAVGVLWAPDSGGLCGRGEPGGSAAGLCSRKPRGWRAAGGRPPDALPLPWGSSAEKGAWRRDVGGVPAVRRSAHVGARPLGRAQPLGTWRSCARARRPLCAGTASRPAPGSEMKSRAEQELEERAAQPAGLLSPFTFIYFFPANLGTELFLGCN